MYHREIIKIIECARSRPPKRSLGRRLRVLVNKSQESQRNSSMVLTYELSYPYTSFKPVHRHLAVSLITQPGLGNVTSSTTSLINPPSPSVHLIASRSGTPHSPVGLVSKVQFSFQIKTNSASHPCIYANFPSSIHFVIDPLVFLLSKALPFLSPSKLKN